MANLSNYMMQQETSHIHVDGVTKTTMVETKSRIWMMVALFSLLFTAIAGKLVFLGFQSISKNLFVLSRHAEINIRRPDFIDRNGEILAIDINTPSLYAEPRKIMDVEKAITALLQVLPDIDVILLRKKLSSGRQFESIARELTPRIQKNIYALGLPGFGFETETRRFYPAGETLSHVVGFVDIDNHGIAGLEKYIDLQGLRDLHDAGFGREGNLEPVQLTIDLRVQHALRDELVKASQKFHTKAAFGIVLDARTGEVVAMSSLPDYDPNHPKKATRSLVSMGTYEMGSVFKIFSLALGLDSGKFNLNSRIDAKTPLYVGKRRITDFHAKNRIMTLAEVFKFSSNIGTARIVLALENGSMKSFFSRLGLLDIVDTELPEVAPPQVVKKWTRSNRVTMTYGHSIAVTPLQLAAAAVPMVNGGRYLTPTFLPRSQEEAKKLGRQVISPATSDNIKYLMRWNVEEGSGRNAEVAGYRVGGKTGTAQKPIPGGYSDEKNLTSFLSAFPIDDPRYVVLVTLDEPVALPETHGYRTAGYNAAPTTANVIRRIAPFLGVKPRFGQDVASKLLVAASGR